MRFSTLCDTLEEISKTSKRLEKTALLAALLKEVPDEDMERVMLLIRGRVFPEWDRTTLGISEKLAIKAIVTATGLPSEKVVQHFKKAGDLGEVAAELVQKKTQATLTSQDLTVKEVFDTLQKLPTIEGAGSVDQKTKLISRLLTSANASEAKFLVRIVLEDLRIGIAAGTIRDSIVWRASIDHDANAYDPEKNTWDDPEKLAVWQSAIQNAIDKSNDSARVAITARDKGVTGLAKIRLTLGKPLRVMLAQRSLDIADAFSRVGKPAMIEYKYDGFRLQLHKHKDDVFLFTRRLENVTEQFPDIVEAVKKHVKKECILDAEVVGYDPSTKRHTPFQAISQRIRRKYEIGRLTQELPVEVNVFDILMLDGKDVYELPLAERRKLLEQTVPNKPFVLKPSDLLVTDDEVKVEIFYKEALNSGYEGLMFKALESPYKPGSRVGFMVKLKPTLDTLDLVITGAEWGEGKRKGWLTSFSVSCQDEDGELREIGKVGTGFKELEQEEGVTFGEMTSLLEPHISHEEGKTIRVKPRLVMEVKFEEIQQSPSYSSGFALRFPRAVRVRPDRRPDEISTVEEVLDLFEAQKGKQ